MDVVLKIEGVNTDEGDKPLVPVVASVCLSTLMVSWGMFLPSAICERHLMTSHGHSTKAVRNPVMLPETNDSCTGTSSGWICFPLAEASWPNRSMRVRAPLMPKAAAFSSTAPAADAGVGGEEG